jgi:hypothetical protein
VLGGYYHDNTINAWGDVTAAGGLANDFGVAAVAVAANVFTITINYPAGGAGSMAAASITATVVQDGCVAGNAVGFCTVEHLGACALGNQFKVRTYICTLTGGGGVPAATIKAQALPFMFKVAGR